MRPQPVAPSPGRESVWDYPRPPRVEDAPKRIRVVFNGETTADTTRARRVLERRSPPVCCRPPDDVRTERLCAVAVTTFGEWKGSASYWEVRVAGRRAARAAWTYRDPAPGCEATGADIAFYPREMDAWFVDDERARPQPGGDHGGWVADDVVGRFRGEPGSESW
ncbi:MAG: DUF427 domain-containing protein [Candidatus Limnocylindria bacterium]